MTLPLVFERFGDVFTTAARWQAEAFGPGIAAHFAAIAAGPKTIVHGDYRIDNMMFGGGNQDELTVIDWQGCGIGCGALEMSDQELLNQSRELLGRILTAIEDLDAWEFLPARKPFPSVGWGFPALSRCGYQAYRLALRLRRKSAK